MPSEADRDVDGHSGPCARSSHAVDGARATGLRRAEAATAAQAGRPPGELAPGISRPPERRRAACASSDCQLPTCEPPIRQAHDRFVVAEGLEALSLSKGRGRDGALHDHARLFREAHAILQPEWQRHAINLTHDLTSSRVDAMVAPEPGPGTMSRRGIAGAGVWRAWRDAP